MEEFYSQNSNVEKEISFLNQSELSSLKEERPGIYKGINESEVWRIEYKSNKWGLLTLVSQDLELLESFDIYIKNLQQ